MLLCPGLIAPGQQSLAAPPLGPMAVVSFALLLLSGPCPRFSLLASGLGCSFLFLQEPLPFLLYAHPRTSPARLQLHHIRRRTQKPGLCNLSSIVSSNSVTKNKSHYSSSQPYVHIWYIYIYNQHVYHMYILISTLEFKVIWLFHINIPHVHIAVYNPSVQCNGSSTGKEA